MPKYYDFMICEYKLSKHNNAAELSKHNNAAE